MLLTVIPVITLIGVFTNEWHGWIWPSVQLVDQPTGTTAVFDHGWLFWISAAYLHALTIAAAVLMVRVMVTRPALYRRQGIVILCAMAIPWIGNVLYLARLTPLSGVDWTSVSFALTGLLITWAVFKMGLLELLPVARNVVFEGMSDGLLVLDAQLRIADINAAARHMLGKTRAEVGSRIDSSGYHARCGASCLDADRRRADGQYAWNWKAAALFTCAPPACATHAVQLWGTSSACTM